MALNIKNADTERILAIGAETAPVLRASALTIEDLYDDRGLPA